MSYNSLIMQDNPRHFFPLVSGGSAFSDYSGGASVDLFGVPVIGPSLLAGGAESYLMSDANHFRFASVVFGTEPVEKPFTLEAWFKPVDVNGPVALVGHRDNKDGLCFNGKDIVFSTRHGEAGVSMAKWTPPHFNRAFHAVGVHTASKNELYVDGVLVASAPVTEEQALFGYEVTVFSGYLYSGVGSSNTGSVIVDGIAVYDSALPSRQVKLHFLWGRDATDFRSVVQSNRGVYWTLEDSAISLSAKSDYATDADWTSGVSGSVRIDSNTVTPLIDNSGLSLAGYWQNGYTFTDLDTTLDGSRIDWDSDGPILVETSLNGTTWTAAVSGQEIPGITEGFTTTDKSVDVRVSFPAGEADGSMVLNNLSLRFYRGRTIPSPNSTTVLDVKGNATISPKLYHPLEYDIRAGLNLYGGYANIDGVDSFRTIEMWITPTALPGVNARLMDARPALSSTVLWTGSAWSLTGASVFVNGVPVTGPQMDLRAGVPSHVIIVTSADVSDATIGASSTGTEMLPMTVTSLNVYASAFIAAEAALLYKSYFGPEVLVVNATDNLGISDTSSNTVRLYSKNWSVVGSG